MTEERGFFKRIFPSREYRAALKRMKLDQAMTNEHFNPVPKPRCFECSGHDVRVGTSDSIPHGCGAPLQFEQKTRERGSFSHAPWAYHDNTGLIVRKEMKLR